MAEILVNLVQNPLQFLFHSEKETDMDETDRPNEEKSIQEVLGL